MAERLKPTIISEAQITALVEAIRTRLLTLCKPRLVYLFGSAAEGRATALSDIDICVIFHSRNELKQNKKRILCEFPVEDVPVDWVLLDEETFNKKKDVGGVCFDIHKYGKVIYQDR
ncbi:MAG: nucleotidyltransferase domain-containing protein [Deltaproteobacteria bacterium]|nr:nucleotidyltransferase domain-containing protein [Deltaproteobacteria bacterium]